MTYPAPTSLHPHGYKACSRCTCLLSLLFVCAEVVLVTAPGVFMWAGACLIDLLPLLGCQVGALDAAIRAAHTAASRHLWVWRQPSAAGTAASVGSEGSVAAPVPDTAAEDLLPFRVRRLLDTAKVHHGCSALVCACVQEGRGGAH